MATKASGSRMPGALFILAILTTLPILWLIVLPVLSLRELESHSAHGSALYVHALGGVAMLGLGAVALYIGWTKRAFKRHRWFGYGYLMLGSIGAASALGLSVAAPHEPRSLYVATGTLAAAWLAVAAMAYRAALNRRFETHRDWMIRSYVLTWTFVGCRMANALSLFPILGEEATTAQIWLFWVVPYFACEIALQWRNGSARAKA